MASRAKSPKQPKLICVGARKSSMPTAIQPMLATLVDKPFSDPDWLFETKFDGVRAVCFIRSGKGRFVSRNQLDMTHQYPELATIADCIVGSAAILDGEICALDEKGIPRFQLLQPRLGRKKASEIEGLAARTRLVYYVFDLLHLDGFDLTQCRLIERKETLAAILKPAKHLRYSEHIVSEGQRLYVEVAKVPLEGIVAKRLDSTYAQRRSRDWLKIKTVLEMEVVVGGYTEPRNTRAFFGALVVGLYDQGELHYVAHVGGGFNQKALEQHYKLMQPLKTKQCPFVEKPQTNEPVQWIKPKLVVQVKFSEWTADRRMRHPIFLGLREDKRPEECTFEVKRDTEAVVAIVDGAEPKSKRKSKR